MVYKTGSLDLNALFAPVTAATVALVRMDERLARSPVRDGWMERQHFADAAAALWLEGELVHVEDLVLHDAHMDIRLPTHELTRAHGILRTRRQLMSHKPDWAFSAEGLRTLTRTGGEAGAKLPAGDEPDAGKSGDGQREPGADELARAILAMDEVLEHSSKLIEGQAAAPQRRAKAPDRPELLYDPDWDEEARLAEWLDVAAQTKPLPAVLRAAILIEAWGEIAVLQHAAFLGPLLVSALLRQEGLAVHHLPCLSVGAKQVPRERRRAQQRPQRLLAHVEAIGAAARHGLNEHDRLILAASRMELRLKGRRKSSSLPKLKELALSRPLITAPMVAAKLQVSLQGALNLIGDLGLREMTGRGRFRAWTAA